MNAADLIDVLDRTAEVCRQIDVPADPFARADLLAAAQRLDHTLHELIAQLTGQCWAERHGHGLPGCQCKGTPNPVPKQPPPPPPPPPPPKGCDCAQCITHRRQP